VSDARPAVAEPAAGPPNGMALTRGLALLLVLNGFLLNGLLSLASPASHGETVLHHTWGTLRGEFSDDSWATMSAAFEYVRSPHATPLYRELFFNRHVKFQYPPSSLLALAAMRWLAPDRIRVNEDHAGPFPSINGVLSGMFIAVIALATAALLEQRLRQIPDFRDRPRLVLWRTGLVVALTLTFYPVVKGFTLGNIQVWINSMLALALLAWARDGKAAAGVLTGLSCLVKPHFGLLLVWGAVRREWRFAFAGAATCGLGFLVSVASFGWTDNADYFHALAYMARHGEAYYPNQSVNGVLNRLMSVTDPHRYNTLEFRDHAFPPFHPLVAAGTMVTSAAILLLAVFCRARAHDRLLDLGTMLVSATVAAPIAWEHHYGVLLPVFAIVLPRATERRAWTAWLVVSYVLASNFFAVSRLLAGSAWNLGQSYLFAGALVLLALTYALRRAAAPATA
jgi:alpha-1,2-mannosyltransferase